MKRNWTKLMTALGVMGILCASPAWAAGPPTFNKDVLPIFQANCQICHRPGGANVSGMIAPMSLVTYREVRPWAKAVASSVNNKAMPPWYAHEQHHGVFENERSLTKDQIQTIVKWVEAGSPRGNPNDAPAPIDWPESGWTIGGGEPDLIISFDEPNWVGDDVDDLYQNITVKLTEEQMPEDRWVQSIEFKPGSEVVHHIIAYASSPTGSGGMTAGMLGGEAPGTDPNTFPDGYGVLLPKGATVSFQMHYHKESGPGTGVFDSSSLAIKFHDEPVSHPLRTSPISHGAFEVPPGHASWKVGGAQIFNRDTTILNFMPHMHLRGVACKYTAYFPDGSKEVLLDVPRYNFNWQISYAYKHEGLKKLPAGTRVEFEMWFDNSKERAELVGFNADRPVAFGGPTWDEMDLGWMTYTDTDPKL